MQKGQFDTTIIPILTTKYLNVDIFYFKPRSHEAHEGKAYFNAILHNSWFVNLFTWHLYCLIAETIFLLFLIKFPSLYQPLLAKPDKAGYFLFFKFIFTGDKPCKQSSSYLHLIFSALSSVFFWQAVQTMNPVSPNCQKSPLLTLPFFQPIHPARIATPTPWIKTTLLPAPPALEVSALLKMVILPMRI